MRNTRRKDAAGPSPLSPGLESGTACISGLIVATLGGGVAVLTASTLETVLAALGVVVVLAFVVLAMV